MFESGYLIIFGKFWKISLWVEGLEFRGDIFFFFVLVGRVK